MTEIQQLTFPPLPPGYEWDNTEGTYIKTHKPDTGHRIRFTVTNHRGEDKQNEIRLWVNSIVVWRMDIDTVQDGLNIAAARVWLGEWE